MNLLFIFNSFARLRYIGIMLLFILCFSLTTYGYCEEESITKIIEIIFDGEGGCEWPEYVHIRLYKNADIINYEFKRSTDTMDVPRERKDIENISFRVDSKTFNDLWKKYIINNFDQLKAEYNFKPHATTDYSGTLKVQYEANQGEVLKKIRIKNIEGANDESIQGIYFLLMQIKRSYEPEHIIYKENLNESSIYHAPHGFMGNARQS